MLLIDDDRIYETELPRSIPFSDLDAKLQVWDDGPPPKEWEIASRPGEMGIFTRDFAPAQFGGWVALGSLRKVTIYGRMKGVRFSFAEGKDRFFGYVQDASSGVYVQEIDYEDGERVTGIVVVREDPIYSTPGENQGFRDSIESTSTNGDEQQFLDRIYVCYSSMGPVGVSKDSYFIASDEPKRGRASSYRQVSCFLTIPCGDQVRF